jgi:hypothetical protein
MGKTFVSTCAALLGAVVLLLAAGPCAHADGDLEGKWTMNANGWTFVLKIKQDGNSFTGTMHGINNDDRSKIEGKIEGKKITFTRDNSQKYRGFLFVEDPTGKDNTKNAMAGVAVNEGDEDHFGWYATR